MSQANSDDMFSDAGALIVPGEDDGVEMMPPEQVAAPSAPRTHAPQGFNIYTMLLLLSFLFLFTATILFFIDSGKY